LHLSSFHLFDGWKHYVAAPVSAVGTPFSTAPLPLGQGIGSQSPEAWN
jgi:hypothetical protein